MPNTPSTRSLRDLAHDLRTPLSVIQSSGETILEDPDCPPEARETINTILKEVARISDLASELSARES
ncbi:hypothetical protein HY478_03550 [Candidatus Uhrbacteria bacterium]|nr:hypothetical protein [Candidatus Uhrbacteria bacterium]